jgi:hypothetical protein
MHHVCDAFQKTDKPLASGARKPTGNWQTAIQSEWRAHANQVKAAREAFKNGERVDGLHKRLHNAWTADTFTRARLNDRDSMFERTRFYMRQYDQS